ncbi:DUF2244 domain-containing protein [Tranquillimonas alkanivorans]|uniref:Uncharacterized membrane protein n=1 Tax=Tranquillimonas alkanivorans TaxID=441119 RepID=A0A1I5KJ68_9RHOB|nr:DUF2244 domain-containing protein [Tranquillimonas alkanivorans]SFO85110.1 Uncharacterized membrane protein [Tranquillimonas alkanivorans]
MPLNWIKKTEGAPVDAGAFSHAAGVPVAHLELWPHRSLPPKGFAGVMLAAFALILVPLFPLLGTPVAWGLLPFLMGAIWLLWAGLRRSYRDGELSEELTLWSDRIEVRRTNPRGPAQEWHANPYWVRVTMHEKGGPVENYVTLSGDGREVELGAFLSPEERTELYDDLSEMLSRVAA